MQENSQITILEITIISAQDLKKKKNAFPLSRRLRPFITVSPAYAANNGKNVKMYRTRVDEKGGINPTWGDKFRLSLDRAFFYQRYPGIYLQLYTKHLLMGRSQLGWCLIPAVDMVNQSLPEGYTRFLSYRWRSRDGSRGHGVVNVAVKVEGLPGVGCPPRPSISNGPHLPERYENDQFVIGIPMKL